MVMAIIDMKGRYMKKTLVLAALMGYGVSSAAFFGRIGSAVRGSIRALTIEQKLGSLIGGGIIGCGSLYAARVPSEYTTSECHGFVKESTFPGLRNEHFTRLSVVNAGGTSQVISQRPDAFHHELTVLGKRCGLDPHGVVCNGKRVVHVAPEQMPEQARLSFMSRIFYGSKVKGFWKSLFASR